MFLHELQNVHLFMEYCDSDCYADDATAHTDRNIPTEIELMVIIQYLWCRQINMEVNYDKTTCMGVETQQRTKHVQIKTFTLMVPKQNKLKQKLRRRLLTLRT